MTRILKILFILTELLIILPYSKTTAFGGVETGSEKAKETAAVLGIKINIGLIFRFSAMSQRMEAKIVIVDELDVTCDMRLMVTQQIRTMRYDGRPFRACIFNPTNLPRPTKTHVFSLCRLN